MPDRQDLTEIDSINNTIVTIIYINTVGFNRINYNKATSTPIVFACTSHPFLLYITAISLSLILTF